MEICSSAPPLEEFRLAVCVLALNRWRNCYECCNEGRKVLLEIADLKVHFEIKVANSGSGNLRKRSKP